MSTVSILMPAYNAEASIRESVESILVQTFPDFELIVMDDGSSDETVNVLSSIRDSRLKVLRNSENKGSLLTRNELAANAKGKYLAWQDADDISHPDRIARQVDFLSDNPGVALCGTNFIRRYPRWKKSIRSVYPETDSGIRDFVNKSGNVPFCAATVMMESRIYLSMGGMRPYFMNYGWYDYDLILRVMKSHRVANLREAMYEYRFSPGSLSRTISGRNHQKLFISKIGMFIHSPEMEPITGDDDIDPESPGLGDFVEAITMPARLDRSYSVRMMANNLKSNLCYASAFKAIVMAIRLNPLAMSNYQVFLKITMSLLKSVVSYPKNAMKYRSEIRQHTSGWL